jgi:hypothetical protein
VQPFDPSGRYGPDAVLAELRVVRGTRKLGFRYELLFSSNQKKADIAGMLDASVSYDSSADVKRTATFTLRDGVDSIDYGSDRIKPWVQLTMPDGGIVEWPQGVFLLSSPARTLTTAGVVSRSVEAYDQLIVLSQDTVSDRYSIPAGTAFTTAITTLIAGDVAAVTVTPSGLTLPVTWDYELGTPKLTILDDLLSAMNYRSAWFDENGILICEPYVLPENRGIGYAYEVGATSVIIGDVEQQLDLFNVPNRWTLVVSDTDQAPLTATVTNVSSLSPTSTVSRGRTIATLVDGQNAADQPTLYALAQKRAYEDSQVGEVVPFATAIMPFHSNADILGLGISGLGIASGTKYEELSWSFDLKAGSTMSHTGRRSVSVLQGGAV